MPDEKNTNQPQPEESTQEERVEEGSACENCEEVKRERDEFKATMLRAHADYQNLQKDVARQRSEWAQMSEVQILEEFIPVYENFKKAFSANITNTAEDDTNKQWQNWKKGIEFIMKQFADILKNHGVEEMNVVGKEFNPNEHDAVSEEHSDEFEEGIIIRELAGGYKVGDKVIQPAKVVVCKKET